MGPVKNSFEVNPCPARASRTHSVTLQPRKATPSRPVTTTLTIAARTWPARDACTQRSMNSELVSSSKVSTVPSQGLS